MAITKQFVKDYEVVTSLQYLNLVDRINQALIKYFHFNYGNELYIYITDEERIFTMQIMKDYKLGGWSVELWLEGDTQFLRFS